MKEQKRLMPRDGAGQMTFTGGTGAIMHMVGMPLLGFVELYKIDRTFRAQTPDDIDPTRTKPDVPWAWRTSDDVGCGNEIVGRVFIQCVEALNNKTLSRGDAEQIKVALHSCKEDLRNCEKAFARVRAEHERISRAIQTAGGVKIEKRVVNDLPQVPNLEHDATVFLTSAKRAVQNVGLVLNQFYGITISNARLDKGREQLAKMAVSPNEQLKVLDAFKPVVERVLNLRNFQEHTPKKTDVENFRITASKLISPTWRVGQEQCIEMLPEMSEIIGALIELAESAFFVALLDNVAPVGGFDYGIETIPESGRTDAVRYRCEIRFGAPPAGSP